MPPDESSWMLVDISVGGVGVWVRRGPGCELGAKTRLKLQLGAESVEVDAVVMHRNADGSLQGMAFVDVPDDVRPVLNDYVSELAERGGMA